MSGVLGGGWEAGGRGDAGVVAAEEGGAATCSACRGGCAGASAGMDISFICTRDATGSRDTFLLRASAGVDISFICTRDASSSLDTTGSRDTFFGCARCASVGGLHAVGVCAGAGVGCEWAAGVTACASSAWEGGSVVAGVTRWCLPVLGLSPKCPPREATACRTCTPPLGGVATGEPPPGWCHAAPPPPGRCCMATAARCWTGREPPL
jgi:hypothetical protein